MGNVTHLEIKRIGGIDWDIRSEHADSITPNLLNPAHFPLYSDEELASFLTNEVNSFKQAIKKVNTTQNVEKWFDTATFLDEASTLKVVLTNKVTKWAEDIITVTTSGDGAFPVGGIITTGTTVVGGNTYFTVDAVGPNWLKIKPKKKEKVYHDPWASFNREARRAAKFARRTRTEGWKNDQFVQGRKFNSKKSKTGCC